MDIRRAIVAIVMDNGDKTGADYEGFLVYAKKYFMSNGPYHHYGKGKFVPQCSREWFVQRLHAAGGKALSSEVLLFMFDPVFESRMVDQRDGVDIVLNSSVNFYERGITAKEVERFYGHVRELANPDEVGINSRLERGLDGKLFENVIKSGGLYGQYMDRIIFWLRKAVEVAENDKQRRALEILIEFFRTGDVKLWTEYNIAWVQATEGDVDYILGFVEVYDDPMQMRGSFECIVELTDFEASKRMAVLSQNATWFEQNAPIQDNHKKTEVSGIAFKVVNACAEAGDSSPSTPIGVNLPNLSWLRSKHGSKSVSLGNLEHAYDQAPSSGLMREFAYDNAELERCKKWGDVSDKVHTALHEVLGHASGQLEPGVAQPHQTLGVYYSTLEEARADLFALYYIYDQKLVDMGVLPSLEAAHEQYEQYLRSAFLTQLIRIKLGDDLEEAHMRNRMMIARWSIEHGKESGAIEQGERDGKIFVRVIDPTKLRVVFGKMLREVQRIKSQGDTEAGRRIVEDYGVKLDHAIHKQILDRAAPYKAAPYSGFINPRLVPVTHGEEIVDVKIEYPTDFVGQHLEYHRTYCLEQ